MFVGSLDKSDWQFSASFVLWCNTHLFHRMPLLRLIQYTLSFFAFHNWELMCLLCITKLRPADEIKSWAATATSVAASPSLPSSRLPLRGRQAAAVAAQSSVCNMVLAPSMPGGPLLLWLQNRRPSATFVSFNMPHTAVVNCAQRNNK